LLGHVRNIPYIVDMAKPMTLNVRVSGALGDFVADNVGEAGAYDNVSEYVRHLIRRDMERVEAERIASLKAELQAAFAAPDSAYRPLDADAVIARNARP
jgi:antitoxin ParD1/3/4